MKIILAGPAYPYRGGIAEFTNRLALQFKSEGNNVNIMTFSLQYPAFLFPGKSQYSAGPPPENISIVRNINSVNPLNWIITGYRIKKLKPDILVLRFWLPFMGPCLGTIARIARSNHHTKVICIFDNVIPHEKRAGDKLFTRYFTHSIDGAVVMSETVGNELRDFRHNIPVKLNPHPLFDTYGQPVSRTDALKILNLDPDFRYILFFGFIRAYKGLDLLISAFADKALRNRKIKLLIAGEFYEDERPYRELVSEKGLEHEVIFFDGFIKNDEVPAFFSVADLVVQPYKSATQSGVTQIAYHYEKPMLVTDVGGLREIVPDGKCGYVVNPDPQAISLALIDFFSNEKKEFFQKNINEERKKFTWDKMTGIIKELYHIIASQQS